MKSPQRNDDDELGTGTTASGRKAPMALAEPGPAFLTRLRPAERPIRRLWHRPYYFDLFQSLMISSASSTSKICVRDAIAMS